MPVFKTHPKKVLKINKQKNLLHNHMIHKFSSAKFSRRHALQTFLKKLLNVRNAKIVHFKLYSQKSSQHSHMHSLQLKLPQFCSILLKS